MRDELKAHIAQINAGTAPAGYKKTKVGIVPEEWETVKLGELCKIETGSKNTQDKEDDGLYPFFVRSQEVERINSYSYDCEAVLTAGDGVGVGKVYHYIKGKFDCHQRVYVMTRFHDTTGEYIYNYLLVFFYKRVKRMSAKNSVDSVRMEMLADMPVLLPPLPEQQKIAEILTAQDAVIALMQKQIELLQKQKKAFLQKMFPKKGCNVPEIRFAGFTDAWEQRKLGEVIIESYNGQTPSRSNPSYWNGEINWCSSGDLNRSYVVKTTEKITEVGLKNARLRIVPKGTFVMAITGLEAAGTRGNCGILGIDTALNQSCMALITDSKVLNTEFLYQWYCKVGDEYGIIYTQGTKQQSYNAELIQILPNTIPTIDEQMKIAEFFNTLDNNITLHQRKLEIEQQKKKALMQLLLSGKVRVES